MLFFFQLNMQKDNFRNCQESKKYFFKIPLVFLVLKHSSFYSWMKNQSIYVYLCLPETGFAKNKVTCLLLFIDLILNILLGSTLCMSYSKLYYILLKFAHLAFMLCNTKHHKMQLLMSKMQFVHNKNYVYLVADTYQY